MYLKNRTNQKSVLCIRNRTNGGPPVIQWSEEMCEIFVNEDISKIDLKQVYQEAEELILEEKFEQGSKLYGKVIWALVQMVRFFKLHIF